MLIALEVSYREAAAEIRDRMAFTPEGALAFRERLAVAGIAQSFVLSTCNRCGVWCWCEADGLARVREVLAAVFPSVDLAQLLVCRVGREALIHLFRVAAGLESMILGEYQILGQVKAAHAASLASRHAGRELDRILRDAITCAKRVKTELDLGAVAPSVCRAGIDIVERLVGFAGRRVLVIGSGRTGTLAARLARRFGARTIAVCNRNPERARRLEAEVGAACVDYGARYATIAASDIVVSATASPHVVVSADALQLDHPVVFLDLASPRDVDPEVAANPLVTLVSIDTIGELAAGDRRERERLTAKGQDLVDRFAAATTAWLEALT